MRSALLVLVLAGVAAAQPLPRAEDKAEADRLFEEGRELLATGDRAEACKRFDLSIRKDPRAVGTMLNLGLCREETGQIATAVRYYSEARDRAHDQKLTEHQAAAERKLALLAPRVPHLKIELPANAPAKTRVLVDDLVIATDQLGDVSIDPGPHTIVITAPEKLPYETKLEIKESERRTVVIPPLEGQKTVVVEVPSNKRKLWGKIMTIGGGVLALGGVGLALYARTYYWDQFPDASRSGAPARDSAHNCWTVMDGGRRCNEVGSSRVDTARALSHVATGAAIIGGLAAAAGIALWLTAPEPADRPTLTMQLGPDQAAFALSGSF